MKKLRRIVFSLMIVAGGVLGVAGVAHSAPVLVAEFGAVPDFVVANPTSASAIDVSSGLPLTTPEIEVSIVKSGGLLQEGWVTDIPDTYSHPFSAPGSVNVNCFNTDCISFGFTAINTDTGDLDAWLALKNDGTATDLSVPGDGGTIGYLLQAESGDLAFVGPITFVDPNATSTDIPEPATLSLLAAGFAGVGFLASRRFARRRSPRAQH